MFAVLLTEFGNYATSHVLLATQLLPVAFKFPPIGEDPDWSGNGVKID